MGNDEDHSSFGKDTFGDGLLYRNGEPYIPLATQSSAGTGVGGKGSSAQGKGAWTGSRTERE